MPPLRVLLFGPEVDLEGEGVEPLMTMRPLARRLLAHLALGSPDEQFDTDALARILVIGTGPDEPVRQEALRNARHQLRNAQADLRRRMGSANAARHLLGYGRQWIALHHVYIDHREFLEAVGGGDAARALELAARGPFLNRIDDPWAEAHRRDVCTALSELATTGEAVSAPQLAPANRVDAVVREAVIAGIPVSPAVAIGRDEEIGTVLQWLTQDGVRLVTVTGGPGIGKSRVAAEVAQAAQAAFEDDLAWISLAEVVDPGSVPVAITAALRVEARSHDATARLIEFLGYRRTLLILDGFEHVLEARAVVDRLLMSCPGLRVLVTSQRRLGIAGEHLMPLRGLTADHSLRLLTALVQRRLPGHVADQRWTSTATSLVEALAGIPLAIELAAGRAPILEPGDLLQRLDVDVDALADHQAFASRHQTLRAAFDWSVALLTADEMELFARLSVFRGAFNVELLHAIHAGAGISREHLESALDGLIDRNLVQPITHGTAVGLTLLGPLRVYAREWQRKLPETERLEDALVGAVEALTSTAEDEFRGPSQQEWFDRTEMLLETVRGTLRTCLEAGRTGAASAIAGHLGRYWEVRGLVYEGRDWLSRALADTASGGSARALTSKTT